uniref:Secreted protein n=1 Tax=Panagrellus redivivus TaxID=6233 RepID=A0A7E4W2Y8_PANRE
MYLSIAQKQFNFTLVGIPLTLFGVSNRTGTATGSGFKKVGSRKSFDPSGWVSTSKLCPQKACTRSIWGGSVPMFVDCP